VVGSPDAALLCVAVDRPGPCKPEGQRFGGGWAGRLRAWPRGSRQNQVAGVKGTSRWAGIDWLRAASCAMAACPWPWIESCCIWTNRVPVSSSVNKNRASPTTPRFRLAHSCFCLHNTFSFSFLRAIVSRRRGHCVDRFRHRTCLSMRVPACFNSYSRAARLSLP
jgi:hypothetical protein